MCRTAPRLAAGCCLLLAGILAASGVIAGEGGGGPVSVSLRAAPGGARAADLHRNAEPIAWCGNGPSPVDRKPDIEVSSLQQIHVLYVAPADGPDRFGEIASSIAADVGAIDAWWQASDPSRRPRWDMFAFPDCATRAGLLDLRAVRLPHGSAAYQDSEDIDTLVADLSPLVGPIEKALVYYDGPRSDLRVCGTSSMSALYAGRFAYAFVWLAGSCNADLGAGGVAAATAAHELVHDLGAVPLEGPPHGCAAGGMGGHVCDAPADLMFPYSTGLPLGATTLDVGGDDYYAHPGGWWDVQDSAWLTRLPQRRLTVVVQGDGGSGRVVSEPGAVDCPPVCDAVWDDGLVVRLSARPDPGSRLWSWKGACSGWSGCSAPVAGDSYVVATFGPERYRLSIRVSGRGRVVSGVGGIDCHRQCGAWFPPGTTVRLRAVPAAGQRLARWTGACSGVSACLVRAERDSVVRAVFARTTTG